MDYIRDKLLDDFSLPQKWPQWGPTLLQSDIFFVKCYICNRKKKGTALLNKRI